MLQLATKTHPLKIREFIFLFCHITLIFCSAFLAVKTNQDIYFTVFIYALIYLSISVHEFGHAFFGFVGGDWAVRSNGYLTLNFLKYVHPYLTFIVPAILFFTAGFAVSGAAVYIRERYIKTTLMRFMTHAGGVMGNALMIIALSVLKPFILNYLPSTNLSSSLHFIIYVNFLMICINLIPIPPLDGFNILLSPLPDDPFKQRFRDFCTPLGIFLLFYLYASPTASPIVSLWMEPLFNLLNTLQILPSDPTQLLNGYKLAKIDLNTVDQAKTSLMNAIEAIERFITSFGKE
jgi:Zn-dependent protease